MEITVGGGPGLGPSLLLPGLWRSAWEQPNALRLLLGDDPALGAAPLPSVRRSRRGALRTLSPLPSRRGGPVDALGLGL